VRRASLARQWAAAAERYKGALLEGFHFTDSREAESWIDAERARLLREYQKAVEFLANAATEAGDHARSVTWRRRLVNSDPLSASATKQLMLALAAAGDRAGAVKQARLYQELVRQELEIEPDAVPALEALGARGLQLVVVSNANGTLRVHMDRLGLTARFDHVLDSADEGVEKPDPRFFEIALEKSGARRETTIHVGDLYYVDVMGAQSAGLRGVLLDEANLRPDADCPRVCSLDDLVKKIAAGEFD